MTICISLNNPNCQSRFTALEKSATLINSFLNYDAVDSSTNPTNDDNNQNWNKEWNGTLGLAHEPFKNFNHSLKKNLFGDEMVICMGAGSISNWIREISEELK